MEAVVVAASSGFLEECEGSSMRQKQLMNHSITECSSPWSFLFPENWKQTVVAVRRRKSRITRLAIRLARAANACLILSVKAVDTRNEAIV